MPCSTLWLVPLLIAASNEDTGWVQSSPIRLPLRLVDRPLSLPKKHFGLGFRLDFTQLRSDTGALGLFASGGYGVDDQLEVGVHVVRWTFSPERNTGLASPTAYVLYRLGAPIFQIGGRLEADIPVQSDAYVLALSFPFATRFLPPLRALFEPRLRASFGSDVVAEVSLPGAIEVQILDRLSASVLGTIGYLDVREELLIANLGARLRLTIDRNTRPFCDASLFFRSGNRVLRGERPAEPAFGNYFSAGLVLDFFIYDQPETTGFNF